jgi:hypothetical protein
MHFIYNFLLTKIFNLMKKTMFFMIVFFFVGMVSINAQYVSPEEAIVILKVETTDLEAQIPGASPQELLEINFQTSYYQLIITDLGNGAEVDAAISNNQPEHKPGINPAGTTLSFHSPNEDQEIEALVNHVEDILAD